MRSFRWRVDSASRELNRIEPELLNTVLQLLTTECSSDFAEGVRLLVDEAMVHHFPSRSSRSPREVRMSEVRLPGAGDVSAERRGGVLPALKIAGTAP